MFIDEFSQHKKFYNKNRVGENMSLLRRPGSECWSRKWVVGESAVFFTRGENAMKKTIIITALFLMILTVPVMAGTRSSSGKCLTGGCNAPRCQGSCYCSNHKCCIYGCTSKRGSDGMYCSKHHNQYYQKMVNHYKNNKSKSGSYRSKSSGSSSSRSSFDPDEHDIESYYDDYRDEYDDYDDAYDGFLDDEDAWDDY